MKRTNWWIYTVLIGSLPILMRFSMYIVSNELKFNYILNDTDLVAFGLVLCIGNLKELESQGDISLILKERIKGSQFMLIVLMSAFLWMTYYVDIDKGAELNLKNISNSIQFLTSLSFLSSIAIYYHPKYKNDEA